MRKDIEYAHLTAFGVSGCQCAVGDVVGYDLGKGYKTGKVTATFADDGTEYVAVGNENIPVDKVTATDNGLGGEPQ